MHHTLLCAALLLSAPGERVLVDKIAATVNDDVITLSDVKAAAAPYLANMNTEERRRLLFKDILKQLIDERLLTQQIAEAKIEVTDDEVDRAVKDILRQNKISEEQLKEAIRTRGMTMSKYLEDLESQLVRLKLVDMKVRSRVNIPESELRSEYEQRTKGMEAQEMLSIRHLFFQWGEEASTEERARVMTRAEAARARVVGGEDFSVVAKDVSEGPTAAQGGSLGEVERKGLLPELEVALRNVEVGQMTPPVRTNNGVHVVVLEGRRSKPPVAFSELRDRIYQELYQQRVEAQMKVWVEELRNNALIRVQL